MALTSPSSTREPYYDGIRAVAILTVISFHWFTQYVPLFGGGYIGVDLFFVLSGFIITRILWRSRSSGSIGRDYGRFLINRVRRLYPALIGLVVVGIILLAIFRVPVGPGTGTIAGVLALVQASSIVEVFHVQNLYLFGHTWSLSVEWYFYLLWPIALLVTRARGARARSVAIGATIAAVLFYVASLSSSPDWFYYGPTSRAAQLLAGCALALFTTAPSTASRRVARTLTGIAIAGLAFITVWTLVGALQLTPGYRFIGFPLVTAVAVVLCAIPIYSPLSPVRRLLSIRPLAMLGRVSYSLYLFHLLGIAVLDKDVLPVPIWVLGAAALIGTIVFTALSYRFLEMPFLKSRARSLTPPLPLVEPAAAGAEAAGYGSVETRSVP